MEVRNARNYTRLLSVSMQQFHVLNVSMACGGRSLTSYCDSRRQQNCRER